MLFIECVCVCVCVCMEGCFIYLFFYLGVVNIVWMCCSVSFGPGYIPNEDKDDNDDISKIHSPVTNWTIQDITVWILCHSWSGHECRAQFALSPKTVNRQLHLVLSNLAVCAAITIQKETNGVGSNLKLWAGTDEAAAHGLAPGSTPIKLHCNQPDDLIVTNLQKANRCSPSSVPNIYWRTTPWT